MWEEFPPWTKVLLCDYLFYYTIVIVMLSDMQDLMWAAECKHYMTRPDLIQPVWALHVAVCVQCVQWPEPAMPSAAVPVIWSWAKSDYFRSQDQEDGQVWLGLMCQADDLPACRLYPILGPDGRVEGPGVSHQCAVQEDLGQTSYVRRQGMFRIVTDI